MSDMPTKERELLDAILDAAGEALDASREYEEKRANWGDDPSADYYLSDSGEAVVGARERFGVAMNAWLDAKLVERGLMRSPDEPAPEVVVMNMPDVRSGMARCPRCGEWRSSFASAGGECLECLRDGMERLGEPLDWTPVGWSVITATKDGTK